MEADKERDALFSGYKQAVKGFLNLPTENIAKAATVLNQHLIDYNIDPQAQLDKETGLLINFLTDLEGKYQTEVTTLALTPFVTALKEANETEYWLMLLKDSQYITEQSFESINADCKELMRLLISIINSSKAELAEKRKRE